MLQATSKRYNNIKTSSNISHKEKSVDNSRKEKKNERGADRADNSRFRRDNTALSADSEFTQTLGPGEYFLDCSDFRVLSYGSVSDFRLQPEQSPMGEFWVKPIGLCSV